jgi:hypothetical protein
VDGVVGAQAGVLAVGRLDVSGLERIERSRSLPSPTSRPTLTIIACCSLIRPVQISGKMRKLGFYVEEHEGPAALLQARLHCTDVV